MAFTYTLSDLGVTSPTVETLTSVVRYMVGDTDSGDPLLQDEEIQFELRDQNLSPYRAAWRCCESIAASFSREADKTLGVMQLAASQKAKAYMAKARELKKYSSSRNLTVYAGGLTFSDKDINETDTDRVRPFFTRDTETFPGTTDDGSFGSEILVNPQ